MLNEERRINILIIPFILVLIIYVTVSTIGCLVYYGRFPFYGMLAILLFTPFLLMGLKSNFKTSNSAYIFTPVILTYLSLGVLPSLLVLGMMTTIWLSFRWRKAESIIYGSKWLWMPMYLSGVTILLLGYLKVGNPWVNREARVSLAQPFAFSTFLMLTAACYADLPGIYLATTILAGLTSYRTYLANVVFAVLFSKSVRRKTKILLTAFLSAALVGVGYIVALQGQSWRLNPVGILHYRLSSSLYTLDLIAENSFPAGFSHGKILISNDPRLEVGLLFLNSSVKYTYTLYGQPISDFGLFGIVELYMLGIILRNIWEGEKLYQIAPAYIIPMLDAGIDSFRLSILMIIAYTVSKHSEHRKGET